MSGHVFMEVSWRRLSQTFPQSPPPLFDFAKLLCWNSLNFKVSFYVPVKRVLIQTRTYCPSGAYNGGFALRLTGDPVRVFCCLSNICQTCGNRCWQVWANLFMTYKIDPFTEPQKNRKCPTKSTSLIWTSVATETNFYYIFYLPWIVKGPFYFPSNRIQTFLLTTLH